MKLRALKILGVIMAFLLAFPIHFLYDKLPCFLTSVVAPVNESICEHMKIVFGSVLLSGVIQKIIVKTKRLNYNNVCFSNIVSSVLSIPIFLIIYLPVYNIIGENMLITLIILFIVIIISQIITCIIINKKELHLENATFVMVIIAYLTFAILTYNPPNNYLFMDSETLTYGINN